jgi:glutathione-regulated potassium-efflux system ancillary protein KefG
MTTQVILAHPALHRSRINAHLASVARSTPGVDVVDLYEHYPDFEIDVAREQERLRKADNIVLQHPMYWYATPALLKEWVDLVFAHGFAYGSAEHYGLSGKGFSQAVSTGGDAEAYTPDGFNGCTMDELVRPMQATAHFCHMRWITPFITHGGHVISDDHIREQGEAYGAWLQGLATGAGLADSD